MSMRNGIIYGHHRRVIGGNQLAEVCRRRMKQPMIVREAIGERIVSWYVCEADNVEDIYREIALRDGGHRVNQRC